MRVFIYLYLIYADRNVSPNNPVRKAKPRDIIYYGWEMFDK